MTDCDNVQQHVSEREQNAPGPVEPCITQLCAGYEEATTSVANLATLSSPVQRSPAQCSGLDSPMQQSLEPYAAVSRPVQQSLALCSVPQPCVAVQTALNSLYTMASSRMTLS